MVMDAGLRELAALGQLQRLHLNETQLTDAGLHVGGTRVTDAGLRALRDALPRCRILR
jgi:hypothetical protein